MLPELGTFSSVFCTEQFSFEKKERRNTHFNPKSPYKTNVKS